SGSGSGSSSTATVTASVTLPLGVQGDETSLHLFVSKVPGEVWGANAGDAGLLTSDLRCISYWLADGDSGLARYERKVITADEVVNLTMPSGDDAARAVLAPEVRSITFSYFDGTNWQDTWDSTTVGADGETPQG